MGRRLRAAITGFGLLLSGLPGPAAAQMGTRPPPAIAECSRLQGVLYNGVDIRRMFLAPSGDFSVLLPGRDWCEIRSRDTLAYTFAGLRLLSVLRWSRPEARPEETAMVQLQVLPLPWPVGQRIPTPETLRDGVLALRRNEALPQAIEGLRHLLAGPAAAPGLEMTVIEAGSRCLRLRSARDIPAAAPLPARREQAETRFCFAATGGAAAFVAVETIVPVADRAGAEAAESIRDRVLASVHFEPLSAGVSPDCRPFQAGFAGAFPRCAAALDVAPEPGAPGAVEVAMGCLAPLLAKSGVGPGQQQRCFAEVLRDAGFRDALPLDLLQRVLRARDR